MTAAYHLLKKRSHKSTRNRATLFGSRLETRDMSKWYKIFRLPVLNAKNGEPLKGLSPRTIRCCPKIGLNGNLESRYTQSPGRYQPTSIPFRATY